MNTFPLCILISVVLASCNSGQYKTTRSGEPDVYHTDSDDREMNKAIKIALQNLGKFEEALNSGNSANSDFSIKVRYDTRDGGSEHIWINDISMKEGGFWGTVGNVPVDVQNLNLEDIVKIDKERISDWMYLKGDTLRGGYTIRVVRNRMSANEKKEFDDQLGFIIED